MSTGDPEADRQPLCIYEGGPRRPRNPGEDGRWRQFLNWISPWLTRKRQLGDEFLETQVLQKRADVLKTLAEAEVKHQKARRLAAETAEIAARQENSRWESASRIHVASSDGSLSQEIEAELSELEDKLRVARLKYGTRIVQLPESVAPVEPRET